LVAGNAWTRLDGTWAVFVSYVDALSAYGLEDLGRQVVGLE
jgi:hypothetical protein